MDGIDWMSGAEIVPIAAALALFGFMGALPANAALIARLLCGAMIGFAPLNRPAAQVFLGDVGSLPLGLLLDWLLVLLAETHFAAAFLLPLYYLADATVTLFRRLANGENVMQAHRSHTYRARRLDDYRRSLATQIAVAAGCALVGWQIYRFQRKHSYGTSEAAAP